jgi:hypothetical protein
MSASTSRDHSEEQRQYNRSSSRTWGSRADASSCSGLQLQAGSRHAAQASTLHTNRRCALLGDGLRPARRPHQHEPPLRRARAPVAIDHGQLLVHRAGVHDRRPVYSRGRMIELGEPHAQRPARPADVRRQLRQPRRAERRRLQRGAGQAPTRVDDVGRKRRRHRPCTVPVLPRPQPGQVGVPGECVRLSHGPCPAVAIAHRVRLLLP